MSETSMQSLRDGHGAVVVGVRGGIGAALLGVLDRLEPAASGCLLDYAGAVIDP